MGEHRRVVGMGEHRRVVGMETAIKTSHEKDYTGG